MCYIFIEASHIADISKLELASNDFGVGTHIALKIARKGLPRYRERKGPHKLEFNMAAVDGFIRRRRSVESVPTSLSKDAPDGRRFVD